MKHILVIEDEALIRDEIVILLEKAGYQVDKSVYPAENYLFQVNFVCLHSVSRYFLYVPKIFLS